MAAYLHTHTHPFDGPLSGTTRVSRYQKGKPIWILLKQETVSGSGISWVICKSASRSRQITTPIPTTQFFTGRMPFLPPNQQRQSTEGTNSKSTSKVKKHRQPNKTTFHMWVSLTLLIQCSSIAILSLVGGLLKRVANGTLPLTWLPLGRQFTTNLMGWERES